MAHSIERLLSWESAPRAERMEEEGAAGEGGCERRVERGAYLWTSGEKGPTWRVTAGVVALFQGDRGLPPEERFVMLAYGGDLVGVEGQLLGHYAFDAVALTPAVVSRWGGSPSAASWYLRQTRRAHEVARLRVGNARERIERFLELLSRAAPAAPWPRLRDMALVTGLQMETVSRVLAERRKVARQR
ncbi:MAG: hypothetical protein N2557_06340 [Hydrogenophilus sp.]|nr:hypothetical protein [Hydrogenophilus sp.]